MDFTGIYRMQKFYRHENINWIDCRDIEGTHGYCSDEAKEKIKNVSVLVRLMGFILLIQGIFIMLVNFI
ncbi:hypothetical protein SD457_19110 [Coprobacillaceae bacterium CR2/5/TPMF4]|nr:hypothetical protein SD457_19110 [Coprobacillaceae bacterium CR2/5/TPMF4]